MGIEEQNEGNARNGIGMWGISVGMWRISVRMQRVKEET